MASSRRGQQCYSMDHSCYGVSLYTLTISPLLGVGLAKNLSHFVGCHFPVYAALCLTDLLVSQNHIYWLMLLVSVLLVFCSVIYLLCQYFQGYILLSPLFALEKLVFIYMDLILCRVKDMNLFTFFCMLTSSHTSSIFPLCIFGFFVKKQGVCRWQI